MASPERPPSPSQTPLDGARNDDVPLAVVDPPDARPSWWRRHRSPPATPQAIPPSAAASEDRPPSPSGVTSGSSSAGTSPPDAPPSSWWRRGGHRAHSAPPEVEGSHTAPDYETPDSPRSNGEAEDVDIAEMLDALAGPYEYTPVRLSISCLGMLSADTQVFRLRNVCGKRIEVLDAHRQLVLKGLGSFKPIGYQFEFLDASGRSVFSVRTVDLAEEETYEFITPSNVVIATAVRKRFKRRTKIRVYPGTRKLERPVELECNSVAKKATMGRYQVATPDGNMLGTIQRHYRKGIVTHQNFTVVVGPEVDPYLMVFLALTCNCVNNERSRVGWTLGAAGFAAMLI